MTMTPMGVNRVIDGLLEWAGGPALNTGQGDGSFVLTRGLARYYAELMIGALGDDRDFFQDLLGVSPSLEQAEQLLNWIEQRLEQALAERVGLVFPSEQGLLDELYGVLARLQARATELLLN